MLRTVARKATVFLLASSGLLVGITLAVGVCCQQAHADITEYVLVTLAIIFVSIVNAFDVAGYSTVWSHVDVSAVTVDSQYYDYGGGVFLDATSTGTSGGVAPVSVSLWLPLGPAPGPNYSGPVELCVCSSASIDDSECAPTGPWGVLEVSETPAGATSSQTVDGEFALGAGCAEGTGTFADGVLVSATGTEALSLPLEAWNNDGLGPELATATWNSWTVTGQTDTTGTEQILIQADTTWDGFQLDGWTAAFGDPDSYLGPDTIMSATMAFGGTMPNLTNEVAIDIKPGSTTNAINLGSNGSVPVAILSSTDFDATTVDAATCSLEGADVAVHGTTDNLAASIEDVNGDGLPDLVAHFDTDALQLSTDASTATVSCFTKADANGLVEWVYGTDAITVVPD